MGGGGGAASGHIAGRVLGAGAPIANSTVTLYSASAGQPTQLGQATSSADGAFSIGYAAPADAVLYLLASGGRPAATKATADNPAIVLMSLLGSAVPDSVTINELTTVASAFTAARFIANGSISGNPLGLRIAGGNTPNLVDPATGGWGKVLLDPINSTQTATLATLNTLGSLVTASFTVADDNWRARLFKAATPTGGGAPKTTLDVVAGIAREPWADPKDLYACSTKRIRNRRTARGAARRSCRTSPGRRLISLSVSLLLEVAPTPQAGSCSIPPEISGAAKTGWPGHRPASSIVSAAG